MARRRSRDFRETDSTYTINEFAEELKVNHVTVRRMIADGRIPHIRIGRVIRIPGSALEELFHQAG